jgi:hypothetical protein
MLDPGGIVHQLQNERGIIDRERTDYQPRGLYSTARFHYVWILLALRHRSTKSRVLDYAAKSRSSRKIRRRFSAVVFLSSRIGSQTKPYFS